MVTNSLTPREVEVAQLAAGGLSNKEIARSLKISEGTIKIHLHVIFRKLGVDGRRHLSKMLL
jgi:DNA-binding NarL/FixJ family response regulator